MERSSLGCMPTATARTWSRKTTRSRSRRRRWLPACGRGRHRVLEVAYVSAPQAALRDQVAAIYNRVGNVKNGDRVEVLEREKRFARVRTSSGIEGWIEQRYLVDQKTFDALQKLTQENQSDPVQAPGVLRSETNLHVTPGRDSEHL